ncbi:MAG TPA: hydantoinase/oxoprolinase family protein [Solirubrobacterales bacterium]|jgi:N-methylhydantoinase A|nr:hydantoinase/oxoprolinase family protein [Solirubrobacterales bacterium]
MRVGIETGGTFTDLVVLDEAGEIAHTEKVFSTPANPDEAVADALSRAGAFVSAETPLMHGSTVATNAMIERKAPPIGLVVTKGFADIPVLQRQDREAIYDLDYRKPEPLVEQGNVREVVERVRVDGSVIVELDEASVRAAVEEFVDAGIESVAVCLLHSYRNPAHEQRIAEIFTEIAPQIAVSLSFEVSPEFREYERATTTTVDAYVKPVVGGYLDRIEQVRDAAADFWVMQSNGGILPAPYARQRPVVMLFSGPAAGVAGATGIARAAGVDNVITLDMGGTSTDVCLIADGDPVVTTHSVLDRLPVRIPMIDIQTVGAGGGSIAWVDSGGMLSVGPQSAGATPGPVCYGRGGTEPTTTDAHVVRGLIRPQGFLGGAGELDVEAASAALTEFGKALDKEPAIVAEDIYDIATANIAHAVRIVSTDRGYDARDFTLVAYGGAGPLHAASVADHLRIDKVLVPAFSGLLSAFGLFEADLQRDFSRTKVAALSELDPADVREVFGSLEQQALAELAAQGIEVEGVSSRCSLDLRYEGQGFDLNMPIDLDADLADLARLSERFHDLHSTRYGHAPHDDPIELVTYRLTVTKVTAKPSVPRVSPDGSTDREVSSISLGRRQVDCTYVKRSGFPTGETVAGPAVVEDATSTTFVPEGWECTVDEFTNLRLTRVG